MTLRVVCDYWRNFKPRAPDLRIELRKKVRTELDISDLLIQGARAEDDIHSPTPGVLDLVSAQRGWRLNVLIKQPSHGISQLSQDRTKLVYTPGLGFSGLDCFNYQLANGTQLSDFGKVEVIFLDSFYVEFKVSAKSNGKYKFEATPHWPLDKVTPKLFFLRWYWVGPYVDMSTGVSRVKTQKRLAYYTLVKAVTNAKGEEEMYIVDDGTTFTATPPDDNISGYAGDTNIPYQPTGNKHQLILEADAFTEIVLPTSKKPIDTTVTDIADIYGKRWWESGNIEVIP